MSKPPMLPLFETEPEAKGHGGKRTGAGRRPGAVNRHTIWHRQALQNLSERYEVSPLDHMLSVLNDPKESTTRRDEMAKAAAPYLHPKLSSIEMTALDGASTKHSIDLTKLSDEELALFEKLVAKSQTTINVIDDVAYSAVDEESGNDGD